MLLYYNTAMQSFAQNHNILIIIYLILDLKVRYKVFNKRIWKKIKSQLELR
jgi:hypothetical protein